MHNFLRSFTSILAIILFFLPMLCLARIPTNVADQTKPTESIVSPSSAHWLQAEKRETSPSNNPPAQSSTSSRPWWVGDLITLFGILVGAIIVIYQLGRQHRSHCKGIKEADRHGKTYRQAEFPEKLPYNTL
jgi:hypothetical protein